MTTSSELLLAMMIFQVQAPSQAQPGSLEGPDSVSERRRPRPRARAELQRAAIQLNF